ncbi:TMEM175 family protein [Lactiplantibacillus modestisalitolerans]|uniref:TMEM175 family protein n=1 Tax=Lactiplantibacillus modestisalitolerans TaxID=1457219 RepID=A0ABV5WQS0_9LACO|nr:TMEM175 family protein [Lactiplantibacillus modestisalitolerans]
MNKGRVEAFTDAIVAIIMTIMVLEMKVPEGPSLKALFAERVYFFAYLISFFLIATTWYSHHYLFTHAKWISKRAFWANCIWLFMMSLSPVATGWIGAYPNSRTTAGFYLLVYVLWGLAFRLLVYSLIRDNSESRQQLQLLVQPKRSIFEMIAIVACLVAINFVPVLCIVILGLDGLFWIVYTPRESDKPNH